MLDELRAVLDSLSPEQRATLAELLSADAPRKADEPIAIVGMAGRFPGARDLAEFWSVLAEGRDAVSEIPPDRWNADALYDPDKDVPGKLATRWGGFVKDVDLFDAEFFGITPREAAAMDPQQRLFLETAWEALEDAGLPAASLARTQTGVFVGVSNSDYMWHQFPRLDKVDAYASSGSAHCIIANRLSYLLDLTGPSVAVDTACSSSLVSVHLACQSLRNRECEAAIAGGVNAVLTPHLGVSLSKWGMMASDGRCKTFDARADGFVRGEGSGVLVLKRLADAEKAGDRVLAVILGSAVNQDGKTHGLTAPNGAAQQAVIRQALARAGLSPSQVSFLETHGTGTSLGDPIEVEAINEVFGSRVERCVLGAVKTNIGHLEPAAGIAGLIKVVLALRHGLIPRNLHYQSMNPHLQLAPGIELANEARPWKRDARPRFAGVSAFSFGGTNAHIVLGDAPAYAPPAESARPAQPTLLPLSASQEGARSQMAALHAELLATAAPELTVDTVAGLRALHRDHLDLRLAVVASDRATAAEALKCFAEGRPHAGLVHGRRQPNLRPVFIYTGQGNQWPGMGRELMRTEPVFRAAVEEADAAFQRLTGRSHAASFREDASDAASLERTDAAQPAIFLLQYALTKTLEHWGIRPGAVAGHSVGEVAAAWAAGMLDLDDAVRVVHHRSRLMQRATGQGAMASVALSPREARPLLEGRPSLAIAAHNSPGEVVLSGDPAELEAVLRELEGRGVRCRKLPVNYAFHGPQMDPLRDELLRELSVLRPKAPRLAFYSTVTGQRERQAVADASHWVRNMRDPVAFREVVERLATDSPGFFLELGPHPALVPSVMDTLAHLRLEARTAHCLRRNRPDRHELLSAVASLYVHGIDPDWSRLVRPPDRRWALPAYPWQRQRFWLEAAASPDATWSAPSARPAGHLVYRTEWLADAASTSGDTARPKGHLVFSDGSALAEALRAELEAAGSRFGWVSRGQDFAADGTRCTVDPENPEHLERLFGHLAAESFDFDHVLLLFTRVEDEARPDGAAPWFDTAVRPVHVLRCLTQALLTTERRPRMAVITRAALSAGGGTEAVPQHTALWGFGRALALEEPGLSLALLDLPAVPDGLVEARHVLARLASPTPERQSAWRDGRWRVPRLMPHEAGTGTSAPPVIQGEGTYLITGGLGSLGLATARRLVQRGARSVALVSRRPPTAAQQAELARLEEAGARVVAVQGDLADLAEATRVFETLAASAPPVRGVIHAAGVLEDGVLGSATKASFDRVLRPKVAGSWNLHLLTQALPLDFFVLFSSATATLGAAGQTNYAAANAFLQGLAEHRRARGQHALCLHWGAWRESTMASGAVVTKLKALGFDTMAPEDALDALERVLLEGATEATIIAADWEVFARRLPDEGLGRFLEPVRRASGAPPAVKPGVPEADPIVSRLAGAPASQRQKLLYGHVRAVVLSTMGMDARTEVRPDQGLIELGLDSLLAVNIANRLSRDLARQLPKTLIYDHPTLHALTDHLLGVLFPEPAQASVRPAASGDAPSYEDIANASADTIQSLLDAELASLLSSR
uniref:GulD n=1 Tax=Pyxidicoccus fallax TaxID=394095 RepID=A0A097I349_9BACT|nr:GulD [Pyxidicoccus fallax]